MAAFYELAKREGYNVVATDLNLDFVAESFMMGMFNLGALNTERAQFRVETLRVIRPLVYLRLKDAQEFCRNARIPVCKTYPACFAEPAERGAARLLLAT